MRKFWNVFYAIGAGYWLFSMLMYFSNVYEADNTTVGLLCLALCCVFSREAFRERG